MVPGRVRRVALTLAPILAWAFALVTLSALILHIQHHWPIGTATTSALISIPTDNGVTLAAPGFLYSGTGGAIKLWTQALLLAAACGLTLVRLPRLARTGHLVLLAWNTLWAAGAVYAVFVAPLDESLRWYAPAAGLILVALACTAERTRRNWNDSQTDPRQPIEIDVPSAQDHANSLQT